MPAVKSVTLVIIIAGEFSTETKYHTLKHDAVHSMAAIMQLVLLSMTGLWKALQARQLQSGKEQVIASNSINLHNRKPTERRWYPTKAYALPLQMSHNRLHLHLDEPWICLQIPNGTSNKPSSVRWWQWEEKLHCSNTLLCRLATPLSNIIRSRTHTLICS